MSVESPHRTAESISEEIRSIPDLDTEIYALIDRMRGLTAEKHYAFRCFSDEIHSVGDPKVEDLLLELRRAIIINSPR